MAIIIFKAMAITDQKQSMHFMSQNKYIYLWHCHLAYINNICVIKAVKLVDNINLNIKNKKYNSVKIIINLNNSNIPDFGFLSYNIFPMYLVLKMVYIIIIKKVIIFLISYIYHF